MHGITVPELWPAQPPRRLFAHPTGTRAAQRRLARAAARQARRRRSAFNRGRR